MVTIIRESGFRIAVYPNDHPPPHVHVYGDGDARIALLTNGIEVLSSSRMTQADMRKAKALVLKHRRPLLAAWRRLRD
jgi:hypothetical protein